MAVLCLASATFYYEDKNMQLYQFNQFKVTWHRAYSTPSEEQSRFKIFIENLKKIDERNRLEAAANGTAVHGITQFTDLTAEEFKKRYANLDTANLKSKPSQAKLVQIERLKEPAVADWSGVFTTPVKDQGYCGSCWAFSATEQLESDSMRQLKTSYILSPQQLVSCDPQSYGCSGGWPYWAFDYIKSGGQEQESAYPYTSGANMDSGICTSEPKSYVMTLTNYYQIAGANAGAIEAAMATYVGTTGPLSICVDANNWSSYRGGVMSICGNSIDHAVQMVGVNTDEGWWKVRNSWGTSWGESGYIRLAYGKNTCDLTYQALYTDAQSPTKRA